LSLKALCALWRYDVRRVGDVLRGDALGTAQDLAFAVQALGPSAAAEPSGLGPTLAFAAATAAAAVGGTPSGVLLREQAAVMDALGAPHSVEVDRPLTPSERVGLRRNRQLAPPLIERACSRLRSRPGFDAFPTPISGPVEIVSGLPLPPLVPEWQPEATDNRVVVELARDGSPPLATGAVDDRGFVVTVWLPETWSTQVYDKGHAVIDGWFVAQLLADAKGRPTRAVVLDLLPEAGDSSRAENGAFLADHAFDMRTVALANGSVVSDATPRR